MELNQLKTLARKKMVNVANCLICGQSYICKDLRAQPICGNPVCQTKWDTAPRSIRPINKDGSRSGRPTRMYLTPQERLKIINDKTIFRGSGHDVRRGHENY